LTVPAWMKQIPAGGLAAPPTPKPLKAVAVQVEEDVPSMRTSFLASPLVMPMLSSVLPLPATLDPSGPVGQIVQTKAAATAATEVTADTPAGGWYTEEWTGSYGDDHLGVQQGTAACAEVATVGEESQSEMNSFQFLDDDFVHLELDEPTTVASELDDWLCVESGSDEPLSQEHEDGSESSVEMYSSGLFGKQVLRSAYDGGYEHLEWGAPESAAESPMTGLQHLTNILNALSNDASVPRLTLREALSPSKEERIIVDKDARIQHVNIAWQSKFGFNANEVVGTKLDEFQADRFCQCMQITPLIDSDTGREINSFLGRGVCSLFV